MTAKTAVAAATDWLQRLQQMKVEVDAALAADLDGEAFELAEIQTYVEQTIDTVEDALRHMKPVECADGMHSWVDETGKLPADTACTNCGETYGDPA